MSIDSDTISALRSAGQLLVTVIGNLEKILAQGRAANRGPMPTFEDVYGPSKAESLLGRYEIVGMGWLPDYPVGTAYLRWPPDMVDTLTEEDRRKVWRLILRKRPNAQSAPQQTSKTLRLTIIDRDRPPRQGEDYAFYDPGLGDARSGWKLAHCFTPNAQHPMPYIVELTEVEEPTSLTTVSTTPRP
jgi:hypothetical protein